MRSMELLLFAVFAWAGEAFHLMERERVILHYDKADSKEYLVGGNCRLR